MLGKKNKDNESPGLPDETLKDKSKSNVVGFGIFIFAFLLVIGLEVYSVITLSSQKKIISQSSGASEKSKEIMLNMAKVGKKVSLAEYDYAKSLDTIMTPQNFQDFKNSITPMAAQFNVTINSISDGEITKVGKKFEIYRIKFEVVSEYQNYVLFRKDIAKTPFKINFEQETIKRNKPKSKEILIKGTVSAYVMEKKEKELKKLSGSIKKVEKDMEREKKRKEKKLKKQNAKKESEKK